MKKTLILFVLMFIGLSGSVYSSDTGMNPKKENGDFIGSFNGYKSQ